MRYSRTKNQPDGLDFMKALDTLFPYREQLIKIHIAYQNEHYIKEVPHERSYSRSTNASCINSDNYKVENIKKLGKELSNRIHQLEMYRDTDISYDYIRLKHGTPPYRFEYLWELKEVYMYLIHVFNDNNDAMIMNSIFNGELVYIIECFIIRI